MSNIIDSLKRLERAGDENSRATEKLKKACEHVASLIEDQLSGMEFENYDNQGFVEFHKIADRLHMIMGKLIYNYDGNAHNQNFHEYVLNPSEGWVKRDVALAFSKAIADGLLNDVSWYIETKRAEAEEAAKVLEAAERQGE